MVFKSEGYRKKKPLFLLVVLLKNNSHKKAPYKSKGLN